MCRSHFQGGTNKIDSLIKALDKGERVTYGLLYHQCNQESTLLAEYESKQGRKSNFYCNGFAEESFGASVGRDVTLDPGSIPIADMEVLTLQQSLAIPDVS